MDRRDLSASFKNGREIVEIKIPIFLWEEDSIHFVYTPALDLTGYGQSAGEAKSSFEHILAEFVAYTHTKKTIFSELEKLGWVVNKKKKKVVSAPNLDDLLRDNEHFNDLYHTKNLRSDSSTLNLSLV